MTEAEIIIFKREMKLYPIYQKRVSELKEAIDNKYYELSGVSGIDYHKLRYGFNEQVARAKWYSIISQIDKLKSELESTERKLNYLESVLKQLSELSKNSLIENARGISFSEISKMNFKSKTALLYAINCELKALK